MDLEINAGMDEGAGAAGPPRAALLSQYAAACQAAAFDFVERSTRFSAKASAFPASAAQFVDFSVHVRHDLSVELEQVEFKGPYARQAGRSSSDLLISDPTQYYGTVEAQKTAELRRPETREWLVKHVADGGYPSIVERTTIRTHPQLAHEYECEKCRGDGLVACDKCRGKGKVSCSSCSGNGANSCSSCGGSGQESYTVDVDAGEGLTHRETGRRACGSCGGDGRSRCMSCGGSGKRTCGGCRGTGKQDCVACAATGWMTVFTTIHTCTTPGFLGVYSSDAPGFLNDAVQRLGFAKLREHADIALREVIRLWATDPTGRAGVEFRYGCSIKVCELDLRIDGSSSHWVFAGRHQTIHDAGGALEALLAQDLEHLTSLAGSRAHWWLGFRRRAEPILKEFMGSEIHQQFALHGADGASMAEIFERTSRALSIGYLEKAHEALRTIGRCVAAWARLEFLVVVLLLAPWAYLGARVAFATGGAANLPATLERVAVFTINGPSSYAWLGGVVTILAAITAAIFRSIQRRWLKRIGGEPLDRWADSQGHLVGKWTVALAIVAATAATRAYFERRPPWLDRDGRLYGVVRMHTAPSAVESADSPAKAAPSPQRATRRPAQAGSIR